MAYHVYLDLFEGPLDLLLFLIGKAQIDIKDIFISKVTAQYLEFVALLDEDDMERASEFIHMAARLLEIKSRKLLPKPRIEEDEEDPEELLIRQLEEYRQIKRAGEHLEKSREGADERFYRTPMELETKTELDLGDTSVDDLTQAFLRLITSLAESEHDLEINEIQREEFTVTEKIAFIRRALVSRGSTTFHGLFYDGVSRYEVIITFMALLEMIKLNYVSIQQSHPYNDIEINLQDPLAHAPVVL